MNEWNERIQETIDWVEAHLEEEFTLEELAGQMGYSSFYCSSRFSRIAGTSLRRYVAGRRLSRAALDIRDTRRRIIDIALQYGFSSQQALTRAFIAAYGCTPAAYRRSPVPIPISTKKAVLFPEDYQSERGDTTMQQTVLTHPTLRVEYIPPHRYIAIRDDEVQAYFALWERHDCEAVTGVIESMSNVAHPVLGCHTAGWYRLDGDRRGYTYGVGVSPGYDAPLPQGFEARDYPGGYYLVFSHPPFDFLRDCEAVMGGVEEMAWNFDPAAKGFSWDEQERQLYQLMDPEALGYQVLRPVKPLGQGERKSGQ